jgi:hypothetical protein
MAPKAKASDPTPTTDAAPPMSRHDAAHSAHETNQRYWIFRKSTGLFWVAATGQAAARLAAGDVMPSFVALYVHAGEALRFLEMTAARTGEPILDLPSLQAAAALDPEVDNGAKTRWNDKKKGAVK